MTRDDFDTAPMQQRGEFLSWCQERGVDPTRLARDGEVASVEALAVSLRFEDGSVENFSVSSLDEIPRVVRGRY